jgi:hypothetical protein
MSFNAIMQLLDQGISSDAIVATLQKESPKIAKKIKQLLLGGYGTSEILKYLTKDKKYSNDLKMPKKAATPYEIANLAIIQNKMEVPKSRDEQAREELKKATPYVIAATSMALPFAAPELATALRNPLTSMLPSNSPPQSVNPPQPQPPIQPGPNIGQQVGGQAASPVVNAMQPTPEAEIASASQAMPDQMQQQPEAMMPQQAVQQIPIFEQLLGGVDPSTLEPAKQEQLKFLSVISDQLQSKGKGINDPEFIRLGKKIKDVIGSKPGMIVEENARFNAGQAEKQANVKPLDIENIKEIQQPTQQTKKYPSSDERVKQYDEARGKDFNDLEHSEKILDQIKFFKENLKIYPYDEDTKELIKEKIKDLEENYKEYTGDELPKSKKEPTRIVEPVKITKPESIQKGESVVTEDGNIAEVKGTSGNNFLIEENGKVRQVPMDSLRSQPEAIKNAKIVFDASKVPESDRSAALAISLPMPDKSAIINMFHDGSFYMYRRKDGKPIEDSVISRIIEGQDIPMSTGETFMGAWNQDNGDSRGSASFKELTAMAQDATKPDDPTKPLIFEKITNGFTHGYLKEFMKSLKEANRMFSAKTKKQKK